MKHTQRVPGGLANGYPPPLVAWYTVAVLFVVYSFAYLDRFIIALLVDPIRRDLQITDFQFGILQAAFSLLFAVGAVPLGWLVDKWVRRWIILIGAMCWSMATIACGLASNFWQLFLARVAVGAGEAALNPATYSILADTFPKERLTLATSMVLLATTVGQGMAFTFGGHAIEAISAHGAIMVPLLGDLEPWQIIFILAGLPGVLLAFLILTIREPPRHGGGEIHNGAAAAGSVAEYFAFFRDRRRFLVYHHSGFAAALIVQAALVAWLPAYMARALGLGPAEIGTIYGLLYGVCTPAGLVLGGWLIDRLFRGGLADAHLRVFLYCMLVVLPCGAIAVTSDSFTVFITASAIAQLSLGVMPAAGASALQAVTPSGLRGRASAVFLMFYTLTGSMLGPTLVGLITDFVFQNDVRVGDSLAVVIAIFAPLSALALGLGMKGMRTALSATGSAQPALSAGSAR